MQQIEQQNGLGGRDTARFLILIPLGLQAPIIAAAVLVRHVPAVKRGSSDYGYLVQHWNFAWIALALFSLLMLMVWTGSPKIRAVVGWDIANAAEFKRQMKAKLTLPTPCEQEFQVWSGQYKLLPKSEVVYESGQRRNKRSA
jgi:hypothetical protein